LVTVPIRVDGEDQRSAATFLYSVGSFRGRETTLALRTGLTSTLRFRIPLELFRGRERLSVEIHAGSPGGTERLLWAKRWEVAWQGKSPALEPMAE